MLTPPLERKEEEGRGGGTAGPAEGHSSRTRGTVVISGSDVTAPGGGRRGGRVNLGVYQGNAS